LHTDIIDFGGESKEDYINALNEIIKFNCFTNEFNYMHDLFTSFKDKLLLKKGVGVNWYSLFKSYDVNNNNLLDKIELK
jgi:hypothetical protein